VKTLDHLIVGGGIAGLATAYQLGRQGSGRTLLLERGELGNEASAQNAAILRGFSADATLRELARRSARFLRNPPAGFGPSLVEQNGLILLGDRSRAERWRAILESGPDREELRAEGVREIPKGEFERLAPHVVSSYEMALYCPRDGRIAIRRLVDALARSAEKAGVELRTAAVVEKLLLEGKRVVGCRLADGTKVHAEEVVIAAGAWAGSLGRGAGSHVELRPTRRHLGLTTPLDLAPTRPVIWSEAESFYHRPERGGALLCVCDEDEVDPDRMQVLEGIGDTLLAVARRELKGFEKSRLTELWCGMRTTTANGCFCVGPDPDRQGLFWVAGLGGHGMSCGIEVGRLAANMLTGRDDEPELTKAIAPTGRSPLRSR
jgi:D-arginine dehydrogenase